MIVGKDGSLYVRIGGTDTDWQPSDSNYSDYREYAYGAGWKVWVGLPGNPPLKQAPVKASLPVPEFKSVDNIDVPEDWANEYARPSVAFQARANRTDTNSALDPRRDSMV